VSTFTALQANADPTLRGENSTVDRYLQVNIGGPTNQYAQHPETYFMGGQTYGTWEAWIYPTNNNTRQPIFSKEASYIFGLDSGRLWSAVSNGASWIDNVSDVHVPMNSWSHVAFIKIGTGIVMYLNGEEILYYPNGAYQTVQTNSNPLTFGWRNQWERFNGRLDEIRIWIPSWPNRFPSLTFSPECPKARGQMNQLMDVELLLALMINITFENTGKSVGCEVLVFLFIHAPKVSVSTYIH
jgi:hypothetical protein